MHKADVIEFFSRGEGRAAGIKRLAEALGIAREAIYQWQDEIPRLRAYELERITDGALRVREPAS